MKSLGKKSTHTSKSSEAIETKLIADSSFPIVAIGASAGGLAAFESFFAGMTKVGEPGMAFVLVQHLDPNHESLLSELIKRHTSLSVFEVEDGMMMEKDCLYIIPPNHDLSVLNNRLFLLEPEAHQGLRLPIDSFFKSLAEDRHNQAIGVILSGTGSDGTKGIRNIKNEGGMVMVQNPESSQFDGMPRSALATGLADFELPPEQMAAQIITYVSHLGSLPSEPYDDTIPANTVLQKLFILLRSQTGHDFSLYKTNTIYRRIERRMAVNDIDSLQDYLSFSQHNSVEIDLLFRDLLIGVTNFFRDTEAFKTLEKVVIPQLFEEKEADNTIRIWVPGCSTGEEAYSLAILFAEAQERLKQFFNIVIFATDLDKFAIETARLGRFPLAITSEISPERLSQYFSLDQDGEYYRIRKTIRDMLVFSEQSIVKDPPFSKLDMISCRNMLIYMSADLQKKIIPLFHYALNPNGFLFLGSSESVGSFSNLFTVIDRKQNIYLRKEMIGLKRDMLDRFVLPTGFVPGAPVQALNNEHKQITVPLQKLTEQTLVKQITPTAVMVNRTGDILYVHGRTGKFLEVVPGEIRVSNLLSMARKGLRRELTTALHKAVATEEIVSIHNLQVTSEIGIISVNVTICPVTEHNTLSPDSPMYVVILEEIESQLNSSDTSLETLSAEESQLIVTLREEIRVDQEYIQSVLEEFETSNEELKSSNEELQSVNEELQSTNEELETSKEELQSVNEELATVNTELQTKVADLRGLNNDMSNLLTGVGIGTIFVDHELKIVRFTPAATRIINLIQSDVGRPLEHIVSNIIEYDTLILNTQEVLDTLVTKEIDVLTKSGAWFTMRIQPYRTVENVIEGAVLTFVDITPAKKAMEALQISEARLQALQDGDIVE